MLTSILVALRSIVAVDSGSDWFFIVEMTCPSSTTTVYGRNGVE